MAREEHHHEHLRFNKDGSLNGLYKLDVSKARGVGTHDYWGRLEEIIEAYVKIHPQEMMEAIDYNKYQKEISTNDYGSDKSKSMRRSIGVPNGLLINIMTFDPEFLDNEKNKLFEFCRRFPGLSAVSRV